MPDLSAHTNNLRKWPPLLGGHLKFINDELRAWKGSRWQGATDAPDEAADALLGRYVKLLGKHHRFLLPPASDSYWAISKWPLVVEHTHADPLECCRLAVEAMEVTDE